MRYIQWFINFPLLLALLLFTTGLALSDINEAAMAAASAPCLCACGPEGTIPSPGCKVEVLFVGRPAIGHAQSLPVASLLSRWFPNVRNIQNNWWGPWNARFGELAAHEQEVERRMSAQWDEVETLAYAFVKVRRQERHSGGLRMCY